MDKLVIKQTTGKPKVKARAKPIKDVKDAFREILNKKPIKCAVCGHELKLLSWNTSVDVLICDYGFCSKYRNPMSVKKVALEDPDTPIAAIIPDAKLPGNPYKGKDSKMAFGKGQQSLVDDNWMKIR